MGTEGHSEPAKNSSMILDRNLLQRDQDYFADVSGLFLFAIDREGRQITDISGRDMRETNRVAELLNEDQIEDLYKRVMQTRLEEQIVENTEFSNMKIAAVAIKSGKEAVLCFIVCAIYYDPDGEDAVFNIRSVVDENIFFGGLDFLREIYNRIYNSTSLLENERATADKLKANERALAAAEKQSEAMSRILELLDSDESLENICTELARISGECAGISHTYIFAPDPERSTVEVKGKYRSENADPVIERVNRSEVLKYAAQVGSKPMVVSSRTEIDYDFRLWLGSFGIIGFVILPIFSARQQRKVSLYIVFADNDPTRLWEREDIKFFGDAARILQSIYDRRMNKEALTSSYVSLKVILNNVGSYICVKDKQTGELIFVNKQMEEDFSEEIRTGSLDALLFIDDDRNDLRTEITYEKTGKTYDLRRNVIKWVDGRYAVLYSLFEGTQKKQEETEEEDKGVSASAPVHPAVKDFGNIHIDPRVLEEFVIYYQPIIDIKRNNKCAGVEALMRWNSRSLGFIEPANFLSNATQTGIIVPIGAHLLRRTLKSLKKWNETGHPYFKAHFNFSGEELLQKSFPEMLAAALRDTAVNPKNLVVEISDILEPPYFERLEEVLYGVRSLGCQIALDDFGCGNLSFKRIEELPVNTVKIGQDFVKNLTKDAYARSFIRTAGELFEKLKIKLCVEGIETEEQVDCLSDMKVRSIQGYYFDRPMPEADFESKYLEL